jgi:hypothetical protein
MDATGSARRTVRRAVVGIAAAVVTAAIVGVGPAAALSPPKLAVNKPPALSVEVWPDHQRGLSTFIVLARLPQGAKLPTRVVMPLPAGSTVTWGGEIDEASASGDTTRPVTYVDVPGGGKAVSITASKSPTVQYEAVIGPVTKQDGRVTTKLAWVQTVPAESVTFASRAPIAATDVVLDPAAAGEPQTDSTLGQKLYTLEPQKPAVGASVPFSISYTLVGGGAQGGSPATTDTSSRTWPWLLAVAIAIVAAMGLMVWSGRRRSAAAAAEDDDDPDDEDEA